MMYYDVLRSMCMVSSRVMVPPRNGAGCGCNVPRFLQREIRHPTNFVGIPGIEIAWVWMETLQVIKRLLPKQIHADPRCLRRESESRSNSDRSDGDLTGSA